MHKIKNIPEFDALCLLIRHHLLVECDVTQREYPKCRGHSWLFLATMSL